jgi:polysaccharide biosynthesis transport protein
MGIITGKLKSDDDNWNESRLNQRSQLYALNAEATVGTNSDEGGLDLSRVFNAIQRRIRIVLVINILAIAATIAWNRTRPPAYEGSFKILIEPVTVEGQVVSAVTGNQKSGDNPADIGSAQSSTTNLDYPTQIQLLLSEKILLPVVEKLKPSYPQISYDTLRGSLTIRRVKEQSETKILEVQYRSASPLEAKQVLNLVSSEYIQYSLSERQTNVRRAVKFVDSQLPKAKTDVRDLESALQTFRENNQLIDPTTLGSQLGTQMSTTKQDQLTTQVELAKGPV